jgi:hypothetical protein
MSDIIYNSFTVTKSDVIDDANFDTYSLTLKILGKIEDDDKLHIGDGGISIEKPHFTQFINRYINDDSRRKTIKYLNIFYNNCEKIIKFKFRKDFMNPEEHNISKKNHLLYLYERDEIACFRNDLQNSIYGLNHLMITYSSDVKMSDVINVFITKINGIMEYIRINLEATKIIYNSVKN